MYASWLAIGLDQRLRLSEEALPPLRRRGGSPFDGGNRWKGAPLATGEGIPGQRLEKCSVELQVGGWGELAC